MKWCIIPVHFEGDVKKWRAVLYNKNNVIIKEETFAFLRHAELFIEDQNESI